MRFDLYTGTMEHSGHEETRVTLRAAFGGKEKGQAIQFFREKYGLIEDYYRDKKNLNYRL